MNEEIKASKPSRKNKRVKQIAKYVLILIAGMVIGSVITMHVGHVMMIKTLTMANPDKMIDRITHKIDHELDLTDAQEKQVHAIVKERVMAFKGIIIETHPRIAGEFDQLYVEISEVLTDEQKVEWDEHFNKMKERFEKHRPKMD